MKKKLFAVVLTAMMVAASAANVFAADSTSKLIGHFKFDENLKNEVGGGEAVAVKKGDNGTISDEDAEATFTYVDGIDGKAIQLNKDGAKSGLNLKIKPTSGTAYTISVWVKALGCNFANPIVFAGKKQQSDSQNWVGIWPGLNDNYMTGPNLGSNDKEGKRIGAVPNPGAGVKDNNKTFDWLNVTITVDNGVGKLYYNGVLMAQTKEGELLPDILSDGADTVSMYCGANGWDLPFNGYVDTLYVFDRVLATEDIQQLVKESNKASVQLQQFDGIKETTTQKPSAKPEGNSDWFDKSEDKGNALDPKIIAAIVAAVVVVVIIAVVVAAKSGKKGTGSDN